ncbi:hypothetical protein HGRIS_012204 [Hohenbuehelia grisea]|uniref:Uncharacterized protein n=1 Tax=Hohenbuehelia grisea TaxID=104357 RepID=A0ABR3IRL8_9AGAR
MALGTLQYPDSNISGTSSFPFARYTSVVGVHTTLLAFASLFLPRSALIRELPAVPTQLTSLDHPQHPFLDALTRNPLVTMLCMCAGTTVLQAWWGGWLRAWWIELVALSGSVEDADKLRRRTALHSKKVPDLVQGWLFTFAASLFFHFVLTLFGAPISSHLGHTYLLALELAALTVFPAAYTLGAPSLGDENAALIVRMTWVRLFAEFSLRNSVERALVFPAIGALIGAWLGVFPIALDWDRPWQAWPLTPAFAAIFGYIIGSICALTVSGIVNLAEEHRRSVKPKAE